jgi:hypothetical protein
MALIKDFTDRCGVSHQAAYWRLVQNTNAALPANQSVTLTFLAYRDATAFGAGLLPLAGGSKDYAITGAEYLALVNAPPTGLTLMQAIALAGEAYALGKLDTPSGQIDADGVPILVSFFDGATQV